MQWSALQCSALHQWKLFDLQSNNFHCVRTCDTYGFEILGSWPPFTLDDWGDSRGRYAVVDLGVSDRWQVTCHLWHLTQDMWLGTYDTWHKVFSQFFLKKKVPTTKRKCKKVEKVYKVPIRANKKCVKGGATIGTCWESQFLPYAGLPKITLHGNCCRSASLETKHIPKVPFKR